MIEIIKSLIGIGEAFLLCVFIVSVIIAIIPGDPEIRDYQKKFPFYVFASIVALFLLYIAVSANQ